MRRIELTGADLQTCYEPPIYAGDIIAQEVVLQNVREFHPGQPGGSTVTKKYVVYNRIPTYIWPVRVNFPPVFLDAGKHFAFHVLSTFDHEFSFCDHDDAYQVVQGHFWYRRATALCVAGRPACDAALAALRDLGTLG